MIRNMSWKIVNQDKSFENNNDLLHYFPEMSADINWLHLNFTYFTTDI